MFEFDVKVKCVECGQLKDGKIEWSVIMNSLDTPGFIVFTDGIHCADCMTKQGYDIEKSYELYDALRDKDLV